MKHGTEMKNISINQVLANPELFNEDNSYGFWDWFCTDASLKNRYTKLLPKVKALVKAGIIDGDKHSVWFKNNYPMCGPTYDDIRFNRLEDDEYVGGVCPSRKGVATYWLASEGFESHDFKSYNEMKKTMQEGNIKIVL